MRHAMRWDQWAARRRNVRAVRNRCTRKVRYTTVDQAAESLRWGQSGGWLTERHRVYCCDVCHGFHIGRGK